MIQNKLKSRLALISPDLLARYRRHLLLAGASESTISRKTAGLTRFFEFLAEKKLIAQNPLSKKEVRHLPGSLNSFGTQISASENISASLLQQTQPAPLSAGLLPVFITLAVTSAIAGLISLSIISDMNVKKPQAGSKSVPAPYRALMYRGQIRDSDDLPAMGPVNLKFRFYDSPESSPPLYESPVCPARPDPNGFVNLVLGKDCGPGLPESLLADNDRLYMGVSVNESPEIKPRALVSGDENPKTGSASAEQNLTGRSLRVVGETVKISSPENSGGDIILNPDSAGRVLITTANKTGGSLEIINPFLAGGGVLIKAGAGTDSENIRLLELASGSDSSVKFTVDGAGNAELAGRLTLAGLEADGFLTAGGLTDAGLGVFKTQNGALPAAFDFTKSLALDFDFRAPDTGFWVKINETEAGFFLLSLENSGTLAIKHCPSSSGAQACSTLASRFFGDAYRPGAFQHGFIRLNDGILTWSVDTGKTVEAQINSSKYPLFSAGKVRFTAGAYLSAVKVTAGEKIFLSGGPAYQGGSLTVAGGAEVNGRTALKGDAVLGNSTDNNITFTGKINSDLLPSGDGSYNLGSSSQRWKAVYTGGADYAEYFAKEPGESFETGDLVCLNIRGLAQKCRLPAGRHDGPAPVFLGVVSSSAGLTAGTPGENKVLVGLVGQLPVKTTAENGPAKAGDSLTFSNTVAGAAARGAGDPIIAYALKSAPDTAHVSASDDNDTYYIESFIGLAFNIYPRTGDSLTETRPDPSRLLTETPPDRNLKNDLQLEAKEGSASAGFSDLWVSGQSSLGKTAVFGGLTVDSSLFLNSGSLESLSCLNTETPPSSPLSPSFPSSIFHLPSSDSCSPRLSLQPSGVGLVDFLGGKAVLNDRGDLTLNGVLLARAGIKTSLVSPLPDEDLIIDLSDSGAADSRSLLILGAEKKIAASITASGSAAFSGDLTARSLILQSALAAASLNLAADYSATAGAIITASDEASRSGIFAPALKTNGTAGLGIIPPEETEVIIYNPAVTGRSLIYLTPTDKAEDAVLFVKAKKSGAWFAVSLPRPRPHPTSFNWLIIN